MSKRVRIPSPIPAWIGPHYVGIDENGVGPRLGPMIVSSVIATTATPEGAKIIASRPRGAIARRIGDSKKLVTFEDSALGEAWARAIAARAGVVADTPSALLAAIAIDGEEALRAPCPSHHVQMCWDDQGEAFAAGDDLVASCTRDLERLEAKGVRIHRARVAVICTKRLNQAVERGLSRFDLDLHAMERLTLAARDDVGGEVYALCGKVGGFDFYADRFGPLAGWLHTVLRESRARSEYLVPGVGRLAFVRDADDTHLVIGLASLVGKWVRDHLMRRVVRYHRRFAPDLPDASGYHDPATTRFIAASALVRSERNVEAACFERVALGKPGARPPTSSAPPRRSKQVKARPKASRAEPSSS